jgi:LmbE family N-acetylglucosaminyl deacetylase
MRQLVLFFALVSLTGYMMAQPDTPVEQWRGKTILLIGAHPDDDTYAHGTLAMLQANGNEVFIVLLTTGNVGTQDPKQ